MAQIEDEEMVMEYWGELYNNAIDLSKHASELKTRLESVCSQSVPNKLLQLMFFVASSSKHS